ncbi:PocR ligand-binding domain-containing protein [Thermovibrio guaymasensis]|uniref:PocR ligand-binding domain-containing protein n=1 Tax=Thermovibrio guaymasensis TaxID=240167 RepID=UPI000EB37891|nr:PocR ligand-binding domain-containing protein [Thermovibrio guaymasensis]
MEKGKLEDFFSPEEIGNLLRKFSSPINASSMVWNQSGKLVYYDFVTPYCKEIYSAAPSRCEEDRRKRFKRALKERKPFVHRCFAQKINYLIPLIVKEKEREVFIGVAGG